MSGAAFELPVGEGLHLRLDRPTDAAETFALIEQDRRDLDRWMSWVAKTTTLADLAAVIEKNRAAFVAGTGLAVGVVEHGRAVGRVALHDIDASDRQAELGYWLSSAARGRGVMTRAARALVSYGFATLKLRRVWLTCDPRNVASRAVAERLGMRLEGTFLQDRIDHRGGYRDTAVYAVLANEWVDRAKKPVV